MEQPKKLPKLTKKYVPSSRRADLDFEKPFLEERERIVKLVLEGVVYPSSVYLIQCNDLYKIGFSNQPKKRLEMLQIGSPYELRLIWEDKVYNYMQIEEGLHKKFENKRVRGEWFKLDKEDVDYILSLV